MKVNALNLIPTNLWALFNCLNKYFSFRKYAKPSTVCHPFIFIYYCESHQKNWFSFSISLSPHLPFSRSVIDQHHIWTFSGLGSALRELLTSATQLDDDPRGDWKAGRIFADKCLGAVNCDAFAGGDDECWFATTAVGYLLRFKLRTEAASSSYHRHSSGCSSYTPSKLSRLISRNLTNVLAHHLFRIPCDGSHRKLRHSKLMRTLRACWTTSWNISSRWDCQSSFVNLSDSPSTVSFANSTKYVRIISIVISSTATSLIMYQCWRSHIHS